jgi:hypothetical protein
VVTRLGGLLIAAVVAVSGLVLVAPAAEAAPVCQSHTTTWKLFARHKIGTSYRECHAHYAGGVKRAPIRRVTGVHTYTTTTAGIFGVGDAPTVGKPWLYSHTRYLWRFRFVTSNRYKVPLVPLDFTLSRWVTELQIRAKSLATIGAGTGRLCIVGKGGCSRWNG